MEGHERRKSESIPPGGPLPPTVTTKSGRASKPSTPALATFQEAARSRSTRNADNNNGNGNSNGNGNGNGNNNKKSQKKAGGAAQALAPPVVDDDMTSGEGDIDADEPTYCYCNGVSYGEMVACDSDECEREWFHLACVGLKVAPAENSELLVPIYHNCVVDSLTDRPTRHVVLRGLQKASQNWKSQRQWPVETLLDECLYGISLWPSMATISLDLFPPQAS